MNNRRFTKIVLSFFIAAILITALVGLVAASGDAVAYLAGITWFDLNGNGTRESVEPVAPNIPVYMRPVGGEAGQTGGMIVFSDQEGVVDFGPMAYGDYQVQVNNGAPFTVTLSEANSSSTLNLPVGDFNKHLFLPLIIR